MDLDLMNYRLDHPEKFSETFVDEGFEDFAQETAEESAGEDSQASEVIKPIKASEVPVDVWEDLPEDEL